MIYVKKNISNNIINIIKRRINNESEMAMKAKKMKRKWRKEESGEEGEE